MGTPVRDFLIRWLEAGKTRPKDGCHPEWQPPKRSRGKGTWLFAYLPSLPLASPSILMLQHPSAILKPTSLKTRNPPGPCAILGLLRLLALWTEGLLDPPLLWCETTLVGLHSTSQHNNPSCVVYQFGSCREPYWRDSSVLTSGLRTHWGQDDPKGGGQVLRGRLPQGPSLWPLYPLAAPRKI